MVGGQETCNKRVGLVVLVVVLASSAMIAACSDGGSSGSASDEITTSTVSTVPAVPDSEYKDLTASNQVTIESVDNAYIPQYATIRRGTAVTFVNEGRTDHNVIPAEVGSFQPIEAEEFEPGESAARYFDQLGTVPYYCSLHGTATKGMHGGLRVVD